MEQEHHTSSDKLGSSYDLTTFDGHMMKMVGYFSATKIIPIKEILEEPQHAMK